MQREKGYLIYLHIYGDLHCHRFQPLILLTLKISVAGYVCADVCFCSLVSVYSCVYVCSGFGTVSDTVSDTSCAAIAALPHGYQDPHADEEPCIQRKRVYSKTNIPLFIVKFYCIILLQYICVFMSE